MDHIHVVGMLERRAHDQGFALNLVEGVLKFSCLVGRIDVN